MKLWKKFTKGFGITSTVFGTGLVCLASGLLGAGTNQNAFLQHKVEDSTGDSYNIEFKIGVGSQSYGNLSYTVTNGDGDVVKDDKIPVVVKTAADTALDHFKTIEKDRTLSQALDELNKQKEEFTKTGSPYETAKNALGTAQQAYDDALNKWNSKPTDPTTTSDLKTAAGNLELAAKQFSLAQGVVDDIDTIFAVEHSGNAMMLSGAILLPMFVALLALGIAVTVIRVQEQKTTKSE